MHEFALNLNKANYSTKINYVCLTNIWQKNPFAPNK